MSVAGGATVGLSADGLALGCEVRHARSFLARARGLLFRRALAAREALWISGCDSIHTMGMHYAIDVVFLDAQDRVLRIAQAVRPLRFRLCRGAASVIELRAGEAQRLGLRMGQVMTAAPLSHSVHEA